jgi:hypothetical protein
MFPKNAYLGLNICIRTQNSPVFSLLREGPSCSPSILPVSLCINPACTWTSSVITRAQLNILSYMLSGSYDSLPEESSPSVRTGKSYDKTRKKRQISPRLCRVQFTWVAYWHKYGVFGESNKTRCSPTTWVRRRGICQLGQSGFIQPKMYLVYVKLISKNQVPCCHHCLFVKFHILL